MSISTDVKIIYKIQKCMYKYVYFGILQEKINISLMNIHKTADAIHIYRYICNCPIDLNWSWEVTFISLQSNHYYISLMHYMISPS